MSSTYSPGLQFIISKLKQELKSRGGNGFIALQRKFRIIDDDNSKTLNLSEFKKSMKEMNMSLSDAELRMLFDHFDNDRSGTIDFEEFIQGVRDPLTQRRLRLVELAFNILDKNSSGIVDAEDIVNVYDASRHPDVIAGKKTADQVFNDFLSTFEVGGEVDGKVTKQEFTNYYTNIGASIDNEDYFELMIRNAWHISGGEGWAANTANRRVLVTHNDGRQSVEEIKNDMGLRGNDKEGMQARLRQQGVNAADLSTTDSYEMSNVRTGRKIVAPYKKSTIFDNSPVVDKNSKRDNLVASGVNGTPVGILAILAKLKEQIKARGGHGFISLQKKFRIMDDDRNGCLDMVEFKKALAEMNIDLTVTELRCLYNHFDTDRSGSIDFEEFIQGVRDPLSTRRLELVLQAFQVIDKDGSGVVDASEIAKSYDPSRHPDVLAKKATPEQILNQFLNTFEVGGEIDGKVTKQEFINYYTNIGASIDNEDYFELMIRNAWHISGGEGWAANTANRRVLVTHNDGRQSVEEIKNDMGLRGNDKEGMQSRLRQQGVNVAGLSLHDSVDNTNGGFAPRPRTSNTYTSTLSLGSSDKPTIAAVAQRKRGGKKPPLQDMPHGIQSIVNKLKQELKSRGGNGFIALQRKFRIIDDDNSKTLNLSEFKKSMKEMNMTLSDAELRMLFDHFDNDRSGTIDFEEFIQGVRDPLTQRRLRLVEQAFTVIDSDGSGIVDAQEIINKYDTSRHPDVIAGKKTPSQILNDFLSTFEVGGEVDGKVTKQEFINYYTNIGASIDNEDYFELMIRNAWHISGGEGWAANTANRRVLVTHNDGRQSVEEIKNDMGLRGNDKEGMQARLRQQGVNAADISLYDGGADNKHASLLPKSQGGMRRRLFNDANKSSISLIHNPENTQQSNERASTASAPHRPKLLSDMGQGKSVHDILDILRQELLQRGASGIIGLQRKFRIMDDDGSKSISFPEFAKAMNECALSLSDQECRLLFQYFDKDKSGDLNFDEFLYVVRGPMQTKRLELVKLAFRQLDRRGTGVIEPDDLIDRYDTTQHPDVISRKKTPNQILREFLDTFDIGGVIDGKVTEEEFINYYTNISASIDDDSYFELMIRNAWHISGGEGWAANTANRRVLVTHNDGRQSVEEIKNDMGLRGNDKEGMQSRLRQQGVNAADLSLHGGVDTRKAAPPTNRRFTQQHKSQIHFG